jgi:hypothetical protein
MSTLSLCYGWGEVVDPIGVNVLGILPVELWFRVRRVCRGSDHVQCVSDVPRLALLLRAIRRHVGLSGATEEGDEAAQAWGRAMLPLYEPARGLPKAGVVAVSECQGPWMAVVQVIRRSLWTGWQGWAYTSCRMSGSA